MEIILPKNKKIDSEQGLVFVGANGCGKTRLGSWIENQSSHKDKVFRITAQKSLNFPDECGYRDSTKGFNKLVCGSEDAQIEHQSAYKSQYKYSNKPDTFFINDYSDLITYLFSEHNTLANQYLEDSKNNSTKVLPPHSKLDQVIDIWGSIIINKKLIKNDVSISVAPIDADDKKYKPSAMSDGERILFYLIGKSICAPKDNIIIIDEPELHLHKTIQYDLWNKIEKIRNDCFFIYLTHDIEFAVSRYGFKKIWVKDYKDDNNWEVEDIGNEIDIPEELLIEVYGNRKKVLLVEGDSSSLDVEFFRNIFDNFFVKPVDSCENVISYTKALKGNSSFHHLEVYGLIDRDRRTDEEIQALESQSIFVLKVAEIENLFAVPEIIAIVCEKLSFGDYNAKIEAIKTFVIGEINRELESQISKRVEEEIKWKLKGLDLSSNNKNNLINKFNNCIEDINIDNTYEEIKNKFDFIINNNDYEGLLTFYNRKSIASRIGTILGLREEELPDFVVRMSKNKKDVNNLKKIMKKYINDKLFSQLIIPDEN